MTPLIPYFEGINLSVWFLTVKVPGLMLVLGVASSIWLALRRCRQAQLNIAIVSQSLPWFVFGAVIGGHFFNILLGGHMRFGSDPAIIFRVWDGQSIIGGAFLGSVAGFGYLHKALSAVNTSPPLVRQELWRYGDAFAFALPFGGMLARIGCFFAHDYPGIETNFWLGVYGICPSHDPAVACHDLGLYESFILGLIFLIFVGLLKRVPRFHGYYVSWLCVLYGANRFMLDWLRHPDVEPRYGLFTASQIISIGLMMFGILTLMRKTRLAKLM